MRTLFERFQDAVRNPDVPWPVSGQQMLRVTRLMDEIFASCAKSEKEGPILAGGEREFSAPFKALHLTSAGKA